MTSGRENGEEVSEESSEEISVSFEEGVRIALKDVSRESGPFEMEDIVMAMMDQYPDLECEDERELLQLQRETEAALSEFVDEGILLRDGTWFQSVEQA
jgi:hypothetical protein